MMRLSDLCIEALSNQVLPWEVMLAIDEHLIHHAYEAQDLVALDALIDGLEQGQVRGLDPAPYHAVEAISPLRV